MANSITVNVVKAGKPFAIGNGRTGQNVDVMHNDNIHSVLLTSIDERVTQFLFTEGATQGRIKLERDGDYLNATKMSNATAEDFGL
jgi:hypothetical protein